MEIKYLKCSVQDSKQQVLYTGIHYSITPMLVLAGKC